MRARRYGATDALASRGGGSPYDEGDLAVAFEVAVVAFSHSGGGIRTASDDATYVNGAILAVDGGRTAV
jgi:hypothetical protein